MLDQAVESGPQSLYAGLYLDSRSSAAVRVYEGRGVYFVTTLYTLFALVKRPEITFVMNWYFNK